MMPEQTFSFIPILLNHLWIEIMAILGNVFPKSNSNVFSILPIVEGLKKQFFTK